jgi:hypothetical protein
MRRRWGGSCRRMMRKHSYAPLSSSHSHLPRALDPKGGLYSMRCHKRFWDPETTSQLYWIPLIPFI